MIAWILIGLAIVNVGCTAMLVYLAMRHPWPALEERATVAVILALIAVGAAALGTEQLRLVELGDAWIVILAGGLILVSLPSIIWTVAYWRGRFAGVESLDNGYRGEGDH